MTGARSIDDLIRPAVERDLEAMARIHVSTGVPGLLTDLGETFLRSAYYRRLIEHPLGEALVAEVEGEVVGFVTWSPDSDRLFRAIFRGALPNLVAAVLRSVIRHPRIVRDLVETVGAVRVPRLDEPNAEIVSLEVAPAFQGLGLGFFLLRRAVASLEAAGARPIKARILDDRPAVERLYVRLGFRPARPFRLHGRPWKLMLS